MEEGGVGRLNVTKKKRERWWRIYISYIEKENVQVQILVYKKLLMPTAVALVDSEFKSIYVIIYHR